MPVVVAVMSAGAIAANEETEDIHTASATRKRAFRRFNMVKPPAGSYPAKFV